eukprot:scaffold2156_cov115-Cylindrotheca_fusiformis.AAC.13
MSESKVCAVFGFGPGLGASTARKWSSEGFKVALLSRTLEKVQAAESSIKNSKGYYCDVTDPSSSGVWKSWDKIDLKLFDMAIKTNVHGLLKVTQAVAPGMVERGEGSILVTGATASLRGKPSTVGFAPAKGGQRMLAQSLARDLHPKGIHVGLFVIDGYIGPGKGNPSNVAHIDPGAIADTYWTVSNQPKSCWSFETEVRPSVENW